MTQGTSLWVCLLAGGFALSCGPQNLCPSAGAFDFYATRSFLWSGALDGGECPRELSGGFALDGGAARWVLGAAPATDILPTLTSYAGYGCRLQLGTRPCSGTGCVSVSAGADFKPPVAVAAGTLRVDAPSCSAEYLWAFTPADGGVL